MSTRVTVLCSDDAHHVFLVAMLRQKVEVVSVVVEPASSQCARLWRKRRLVDWVYNRYHKIRRDILGLNAYRRRYFQLGHPISEFPDDVHVVQSINDDSALDVIESTQPDVTVVMGTSILRKRILRAAGDKIINIHGGILPDYKGNHCFFFAMDQGRFDRIGSTIHFVDSGVDTGDIIAHVFPKIHPTDSPETLYCRAEKMAILRLVELVEAYGRGHPFPRNTQLDRGRNYRTRDRGPLRDLAFLVRRRLGWIRVPELTPDEG